MFVRKNMDWTGMMETVWNTQQTPGTSKLEARRHPGLWTQPMIEFPRGARLVRKTQRTETIFEVDGSSPERLGHVDPARVSAREELFSLVLKNSLVDLKVCKLFPGIFTDFHSKLFRDWGISYGMVALQIYGQFAGKYRW